MTAVSADRLLVRPPFAKPTPTIPIEIEPMFPILDRLFPLEMRQRVSHRIEYGALRAITAVLDQLGIDRASALMGWIWRKVAPLNRRHARADQHLAAAMPHLTADERARILDRMWDNLGRTAAETVLLPRLVAESDRIELVDNGLNLEKAREGAVFVSLHTGNWEVVSIPLRRAGFDITAIYKPLTNPLVEQWLADQRRSLYGAGLTRLDRGIALKIRTLAKGGAVVAVVGDHRDDTHVVIDFFGRPSGALPFPALLARRFSLPLYVARTIRTEGAHFRVEGREMEIPLTDDVQADIVELTRRIHAQFEEWISEYPDQWMWAHRKWF